ncbi:MAG: XylR family transcriptional regulator [Thermoguttaceae bacterium]
MPHTAPRVALLIETSRGYGRGLLRGITKYARLHGPWQFHLTPGDFDQIVPRMKEWGGSGIIARVINEQAAELVFKTKLPAVLLDLPNTPAVRRKAERLSYLEMASDSVGAAKLVAESLLAKQFQHFAFVGYHRQVWSERREKAFVDSLAESGRTVYVYSQPTVSESDKAMTWEQEEPRLAAWLAKLPKPVGLMACNDQRGREVLDACEAGNVMVPEEVAVIGVDNDELLCDLSYPPLSSVAMNAVQGGYLAAKSLDAMMRGNKPPVARIVVAPIGVVERRSSDIVAMDDHDIAAALRFIHTEPPSRLTIGDVVAHVAVSRRALEMRFRSRLGRTLLQEIQRVRLERAKRILHETDTSVAEIAEILGLATESYFTQFFRSATGITPAQYRRSVRVG